MTGLVIEESGGTMVLRGEFDMSQTDVWEAAVGPLTEGERRADDLTLDLHDLSFVDSSAIRCFLQTAKALAPARLHLRSPQPMVGRVLAMTSLTDHPNIEVD